MPHSGNQPFDQTNVGARDSVQLSIQEEPLTFTMGSFHYLGAVSSQADAPQAGFVSSSLYTGEVDY